MLLDQWEDVLLFMRALISSIVWSITIDLLMLEQILNPIMKG